jgi:hypothetical protein
MTKRRQQATWMAFGVAAWAGLLLLACAPRPTGPPFVDPPSPAPDRARLTVYRLDPRASVSPVRVRIDGVPIGVLHHGEYETVEVAPGVHEIEAGVRSVAWVAWGWNDLDLRVEPGETAYLKVSVRLTERSQPGGRALDIAGRPSGAVSENVYLQPMGASEARRELADTTRILPPAAPDSVREP